MCSLTLFGSGHSHPVDFNILKFGEVTLVDLFAECGYDLLGGGRLSRSRHTRNVQTAARVVRDLVLDKVENVLVFALPAG